MSIEAFERSPPPLFRHGLSAFSRLLIYIALGILIMVSDHRWNAMSWVRQGVHSALYPVQWVLLQPLRLTHGVSEYFVSRAHLEAEATRLRSQNLEQTQHAQARTLLEQENHRLRGLLQLKERPELASGIAAEIMQEFADGWSYKVLLNKGLRHGVQEASAVIDPWGIMGQVTRAWAFTSEVTLAIDHTFVIPVINVRTGVRSVAFGSPGNEYGTMELRFASASADIAAGDIFSTSGIDGIYPAGLHVAKVARVDRRVNSTFSKVYLLPLGKPEQGAQVMVLPPQPAALTRP